jgi:hypothetical protein
VLALLAGATHVMASGDTKPWTPPLSKCSATASAPSAVAPDPAEPRQRWQRSELTDERTGTAIRLTAAPGGALQVSVSGPDFEFRKVTQTTGDYQARLRSRQDVVVLARTGDRLRVTHAGRTAVVNMGHVVESDLDDAQQVLAGSRAVRAFRSMHARLSEDALDSAPGLSLETVDALLGVLQGETSMFTNRHQRPAGRVAHTAFEPRRSCFEEYVGEVVVAWGDLSSCVNDLMLIPGGPEVCAFVWAIRVESAWFQFVGCSSFPLKLE